MSQESLILKYYKGDNNVAVFDTHNAIQLKNLGVATPKRFHLLDAAVRNGDVSFDYLLSDAVSNIDNIEIDEELHVGGATPYVSENPFPHTDALLEELDDFELGDPVIFMDKKYTLSSFNFDTKPITADIVCGINKRTVELSALNKPALFGGFKESQRVFVKGLGQTPCTVLTLNNVNGDETITVECFIDSNRVDTYNLLEHEISATPPQPNNHNELTMSPSADNEVNKEEHTGGSSSYYMTYVANPTTLDEPYRAECNDIIEALDLTYAEANIIKAVWRTAAARQGKKKKGNNNIYDAEKVVFFGPRMLIAAEGGERR